MLEKLINRMLKMCKAVIKAKSGFFERKFKKKIINFLIYRSVTDLCHFII